MCVSGFCTVYSVPATDATPGAMVVMSGGASGLPPTPGLTMFANQNSEPQNQLVGQMLNSVAVQANPAPPATAQGKYLIWLNPGAINFTGSTSTPVAV